MRESLFAVFVSGTEPLAGKAPATDINNARELLKLQNEYSLGVIAIFWTVFILAFLHISIWPQQHKKTYLPTNNLFLRFTSTVYQHCFATVHVNERLMVQQLRINISGDHYYNFVNVSQVIRGDNWSVIESATNSCIHLLSPLIQLITNIQNLNSEDDYKFSFA